MWDDVIKFVNLDGKYPIKETKVTYEDCQYCCDDVGMRDYILSDGDGGIFIDESNTLENNLEFVIFNKKINYCPMCGRKL